MELKMYALHPQKTNKRGLLKRRLNLAEDEEAKRELRRS